MKNLIKITSAIILTLFCATGFILASETTGVLNPNVNTGISGTLVVAPSANVPSGTYTSVQNVSLAAIGSHYVKYTTGSTIDCATGNTYSAPISVSATSTIKAIACYGNNVYSSVSSFEYVINLPPETIICESFTYSNWGSCQSNSTQTRTVLTSLPSGCVGGTPVTSQTCTYTPPAGGGGGGGGAASPAAPPVTPTTTKTGDANGDNKVDKYDFALLMSSWGQSVTNSTVDLNKDGKVDKYDFALLMLNWNK